MLETIPTDEAYSAGRALEVRYRRDPGEPGLLRVSVLALALEVDGDPDRIRRSEAAFVTTDEAMTREAMRERVEAEAARRAIGRVAWVEEA
jgi:hypothetical protein